MVLTAILTAIGLSVFEVVSSIDNAVINADVLGTMQPKSRKFFLTWGLVFAVFVIRGLLPWLIVWLATPSIGPVGALVATFSGNADVHSALAAAAPFLQIIGGVFLLFLFFNWLFLEEKRYSLVAEKFFTSQGVWFYAITSLLLVMIVWLSLNISTKLAMGAVIGSTVFFILHGFKQNAEHQEEQLKSDTATDGSKILYLEVIDSVFSIDGVLGAFAFTLSVPLILIGNGIGALVVRQLTTKNVETIKKYYYLKNGAMYSILFLGAVMLLDAFGVNIPDYVSPIVTLAIVGLFFLKSHREIVSS